MFKRTLSFVLTSGALLTSFTHADSWLTSDHKGLASPPGSSASESEAKASNWRASLSVGYGLANATVNSQISSSLFDYDDYVGGVNLDFNGPKALVIPSFGYGDIFEMRFKGSGSWTYSSQISSPVGVRHTAQGYMFSGEGTLFFGIPCGRGFTLMPAFGWGIEQTYAKARPDQVYKLSFMQRFFIPHAGLYFQIAPKGNVFMRAGVSALMPTGRLKISDTDSSAPVLAPYQKLKASRSGIKGELEVRYRLSANARAFLMADYKSYGVRGSVNSNAVQRAASKALVEEFSMCIGMRFGF